MKVSKTELDGVLLVETKTHWDKRGLFEETFNRKEFLDAGLPVEWPQDSLSFNHDKNTLRGLHTMTKNPQGKFVRCLDGAIIDVAACPITGKTIMVKLENSSMGLYVPPGMLHGYFTLTPGALVYYKCTTLHDSKFDGGVRWNDPDLDIMWPTKDPNDIIISDKDRRLPFLKDYLNERNEIGVVE